MSATISRRPYSTSMSILDIETRSPCLNRTAGLAVHSASAEACSGAQKIESIVSIGWWRRASAGQDILGTEVLK